MENSDLARYQLSVLIEKAREEERKKISRRVHDELGGVLAAIKIRLGLFHNAGQISEADYKDVLDLCDYATQTSKQISRELMFSIPDNVSCRDLIMQYCNRFCSKFQLKYNLEIPPSHSINRAELSLFLSFLQELINNVGSYAGASCVYISFKAIGGGSLMMVMDDGVGINMQSIDEDISSGLRSIRERTIRNGGTFTVKKRNEGGTLASVWLPTDS